MEAIDTLPGATSTLSRFHETSAKFQRYKILLRRRWWFLLLTAAIAICVEALRITGQATQYIALGKVVVGATMVNADPAKSAAQVNLQTTEFYGTQIEMLESGELRRHALDRVRGLHPEFKEIEVETRVTQTKGSSILNVAVVGEEPNYTKVYLNSLLDEYIAFRRKIIEDSVGGAVTKVIEEVLGRDKLVKQKKDALDEYLGKNDIALFEGDRNAAATYLRALQAKLDVMQTEYTLMEKMRMENYLRSKERVAAPAAAVPGNPSVDSKSMPSASLITADDVFGGLSRPEQDYLNAMNELKMLKSERNLMLQTYRPAHELVKELDDKIAKQDAKINIYREASEEEWARRKDGLQLKLEHLKTEIAAWETKAREANAKIVQYQTLKSDFERTKQDLDDWKKTLDRLDTTHTLIVDPVSIMERPLVAVENEPQLAVPLMVALFIGLAAGSVILLLFDRLDDRMNSFSEFQALFPNESILGQIPEQSGRGDVTILRPNDDRHLYAEAFRNLRSSILFKNWKGGKPPKLILVTSAVPNEGKTTTVANLAVTLALGGARVLLGDADLRRGGVNELFKAPASPGFAEVLSSKLHWRDAVQETTTKGLHILPRGEAIDQTSELFLSPLAQDVLKEMGDEYDYVIFDSAPVLVADDTASLAPKLEAVLFVVRMSSTMARLSAKALDALYDRQVNVAGVILNRSSTNLKEYTYYNYASYYSISARKGRDGEATA